jgi:hypothetical protein
MATSDDTAHEGTDFTEQIADVTLPETVTELVADYDRLYGDRSSFLWRWIYSLFPEFTLSSVADGYAAEARTQKTVLTMYVTVLDDLVEHHGDRRTFEEARCLPREGKRPDRERVAVDEEQFAFIERLWETFADGVAWAPRHDEFADVFRYDVRQTLNAMEYSAVVNGNPRIANLSGARRYGAHNMVMFPYADVDLMYSPAFDTGDFGAVRDLLWDLQEMARIGNWLTTWEREIREGDYTAGVIVAALEEGVVTTRELRHREDDAIEAIRNQDIEERFRRRWRERYRSVRDREFAAESVDLDALVSGMETVFEYHLASRGHK